MSTHDDDDHYQVTLEVVTDDESDDESDDDTSNDTATDLTASELRYIRTITNIVGIDPRKLDAKYAQDVLGGINVSARIIAHLIRERKVVIGTIEMHRAVAAEDFEYALFCERAARKIHKYIIGDESEDAARSALDAIICAIVDKHLYCCMCHQALPAIPCSCGIATCSQTCAEKHAATPICRQLCEYTEALSGMPVSSATLTLTVNMHPYIYAACEGIDRWWAANRHQFSATVARYVDGVLSRKKEESADSTDIDDAISSTDSSHIDDVTLSTDSSHIDDAISSTDSTDIDDVTLSTDSSHIDDVTLSTDSSHDGVLGRKKEESADSTDIDDAISSTVDHDPV